MSDAFALSVVIPTRNRRASLLRALQALMTQTIPTSAYEVIVAIDGSTDGTREAVAAFAAPYALRAVPSTGRGRAAACNSGARAACGALLVFLDDDMEPGEEFLEAHGTEHPPGSRLGVVGAVPVSLDAPAPPVAVFIGEKFNRHLERLAKHGHRMTFRDFYSGNFSIRRDLFLGAGGFDEEFRIYGNEDGELALRLMQTGVELRYSTKAVARQNYEKDFAALAQDNIAKGRTAVLLSRKWPAARSELRFARRQMRSRKWRAALASLLFVSRFVPVVPDIAIRAVLRVERRRPRRLDVYYRFALDYFYLFGAQSELSERREPARDRGGTLDQAGRTVIQYTDSTGFGGAEIALLTLLEGLDRRRWTPVLFHHDSPGIRPLLEAASRLGVRTRSVARPQGPFDLFRLMSELRSERPGVFHAHLPWALRCGSGLVAAALAGVPAVIATQQLFRGIASPRQIVRQWMIGLGVDRYIAVSADMAGCLGATPLFPARKVQIIPNAVDVRRFPAKPDGALRAKFGGVPARPIVLTLARLDHQKGLSELLEAAVRVTEANFLLAGEGPERRRLEDLARSLGVDSRVIFLGHREDVPELLAACDVFVLPSHFEGLPLSVLEAMAAGKPVVATAIGGTQEAVSDGETGVLVPPRDPAALAAAIQSVISDPLLARRLGGAGRERALRDFSAEKIVREISQLYDNVLARRSAVVPKA